ncbi:MAG: hypothetical protein ACRD4O_07925 [Bryobacteraceae bacterium]
MTRPKLKHSLVQGKLRDCLRKLAEPGSYVEVEMAFRPLPEHELWVADVAYLSAVRFREARAAFANTRSLNSEAELYS